MHMQCVFHDTCFWELSMHDDEACETLLADALS